jgi:ABC-type phosphate transport system ATPase subunit
MAIIETNALTREFDSLTAVDSLSVAVEPGEIFWLLEPNGAGKTTVMKMLPCCHRLLVQLLWPASASRGRPQTCDVSLVTFRSCFPQMRRSLGMKTCWSLPNSMISYEASESRGQLRDSQANPLALPICHISLETQLLVVPKYIRGC